MRYGRHKSGEHEPSFQTVSFIADTFGTTTDSQYGNTEDSSSQTITISADENPEIFQLLETINKDNDFAKRLLLYLSKLAK